NIEQLFPDRVVVRLEIPQYREAGERRVALEGQHRHVLSHGIGDPEVKSCERLLRNPEVLGDVQSAVRPGFSHDNPHTRGPYQGTPCPTGPDSATRRR